MARPASRAVAFFTVSTEETENRFGIWEAKGLHLSRRLSVTIQCVYLYDSIAQSNMKTYIVPS